MPEDLVSHSARKDVVAFPAAAGVLSRLVAERFIQGGIDVAPLLRKAGLPDTLLDGPSTRVSAQSQIEFIKLAAEAVDDNLFGFHLAKDADLREAGPIYYLMASSETLGEAFDHAVRYSSIVNEGIQMQRGASAFTLEFEYAGVKRITDRHQVEFWLTATLRLSRLFTGRELIPMHVSLVHQREGDVSDMERYFGCELEFGAAKDQISFDPQDARLSLVFADRILNRFLVDYFEDANATRQSHPQSVRMRVENAIMPRLPHGTTSIGNIAGDLGMSARTLSRRLADEGLTFSAVLEELRSDLANRYLQGNSHSVSEIAWLLGYSEVSSFVHAFQRWTGTSPTSVRRKAIDPQPTEKSPDRTKVGK